MLRELPDWLAEVERALGDAPLVVLALPSEGAHPARTVAVVRAALECRLAGAARVVTAHALEDDATRSHVGLMVAADPPVCTVVLAFDSEREDGRLASLVDAVRLADAFRGRDRVRFVGARASGPVEVEARARDAPSGPTRASPALAVIAVAGRPVSEMTVAAIVAAGQGGEESDGAPWRDEGDPDLWIDDGWVSLPSERRRVEIVSRLAPDTRTGWLRELARVSAGRHHHERAAEYLCALGAWDAATEHLAAGARAAFARGRWGDAARLAAQALQRPGSVPTPAERQRLQLLRGRALSAHGEAGPATDAFIGALHGPDVGASREARARGACEALVAGRLHEGDMLLAQALRELGLGAELGRTVTVLGVGARRLLMMLRRSRAQVPGGEPVRAEDEERLALLYAATVAVTFVDGVRVLALQTRYLALALDVGAPRHVARALALERTVVAARGVAARERVAALDAIVEARLAGPAQDAVTLGVDAGTRAQAAFFRGDFREALGWIDTAEARFVSAGEPAGAELYVVRVFRIWAWLWLGEVDALRRVLRVLGERARRSGHRALADTLVVEAGTVVALLDDEPARALADAERAWGRHASRRVLPVAAFNAWVALVNARLYRGERDSAWTLVDGAWTRFGLSGFLLVQVLRVEAWVVRGRAALACGRDEEVARACRRLRREGVDYARALAAFLELGLALRRGDASDERSVGALRACERAGLGLYAEAIALARGEGGRGLGCSSAGLRRMMWGFDAP